MVIVIFLGILDLKRCFQGGMQIKKKLSDLVITGSFYNSHQEKVLVRCHILMNYIERFMKLIETTLYISFSLSLSLSLSNISYYLKYEFSLSLSLSNISYYLKYEFTLSLSLSLSLKYIILSKV